MWHSDGQCYIMNINSHQIQMWFWYHSTIATLQMPWYHFSNERSWFAHVNIIAADLTVFETKQGWKEEHQLVLMLIVQNKINFVFIVSISTLCYQFLWMYQFPAQIPDFLIKSCRIPFPDRDKTAGKKLVFSEFLFRFLTTKNNDQEFCKHLL